MIELPTESEPVKVIEGDCLEVLPRIPSGAVVAVVSDPPYGMAWNTNSKRFTGGCRASRPVEGRDDWAAIQGDQKPFDPAPWLMFPKVVLWGYHHFAERLPVGTVLVWLKKNDEHFGTFLSDAELGWMKGGYGVYAHRKLFPPTSRMKEHNGTCAHPTQKPLSLMKWCIQKLKLGPGSLIIDPYAGSGTTGIAAAQLGMRCILIEKEPAYAAVCRERIAKALGAGMYAETGAK